MQARRHATPTCTGRGHRLPREARTLGRPTLSPHFPNRRARGVAEGRLGALTAVVSTAGAKAPVAILYLHHTGAEPGLSRELTPEHPRFRCWTMITRSPFGSRRAVWYDVPPVLLCRTPWRGMAMSCVRGGER